MIRIRILESIRGDTANLYYVSPEEIVSGCCSVSKKREITTFKLDDLILFVVKGFNCCQRKQSRQQLHHLKRLIVLELSSEVE